MGGRSRSEPAGRHIAVHFEYPAEIIYVIIPAHGRNFAYCVLVLQQKPFRLFDANSVYIFAKGLAGDLLEKAAKMEAA